MPRRRCYAAASGGERERGALDRTESHRYPLKSPSSQMRSASSSRSDCSGRRIGRRAGGCGHRARAGMRVNERRESSARRRRWRLHVPLRAASRRPLGGRATTAGITDGASSCACASSGILGPAARGRGGWRSRSRSGSRSTETRSRRARVGRARALARGWRRLLLPDSECSRRGESMRLRIERHHHEQSIPTLSAEDQGCSARFSPQPSAGRSAK